jgi:hypothetical protein
MTTYLQKHVYQNYKISLSRRLKSRTAWDDLFQALKELNFSPRLLYTTKLSFNTDGEIKNFQNKY